MAGDCDRAITHAISGRGVQRNFRSCTISTRTDETTGTDETSQQNHTPSCTFSSKTRMAREPKCSSAGRIQKKGRPSKKWVGVDSSGLEERRRSSYYLWRLKKRVRKRDFRKLHLASECRLPEKVIYAWQLTSPKKGDSSLFAELIGCIADDIAAVLGDTAYCSRENAQLVEDRKGIPFLKPRKDATTRAGTHPAWRRMIFRWKRGKKRFEKVYHSRSNCEATNSSFKRTWGCGLYSRKRWNQQREIGLKVITHNMCLLIRFRIRIRLEREVR